MSIFANLKKDGLEQAQDRLGGQFGPLDTAIYTGEIKAAYVSVADSGAQAVNLIVDFDGREYRETVYVTNKKGEPFYVKNDKKMPLPGFTNIDDLCQVTCDKSLSEMDAEEKVIKLYDNDAKGEIPKAVPMLVELLGKTASFAIQKSLVNKNARNDQTGEYEPTAEEKEENGIDKVFHTDTKQTVVELMNQAKEAVFWGAWEEKNKGKVRDRREIKDGQAPQASRPGLGKAAAPAGAPAAAAAAPARKSLFGAKAA